jgi:hypothetical protein
MLRAEVNARALRAIQDVKRFRPPNKPAKTSSIDLFQFLGLRLHFEEEDLFHFYVSFEEAHFGKLLGSLFGGFKAGRRGLLTRAYGRSQFPPGVFTRGSN